MKPEPGDINYMLVIQNSTLIHLHLQPFTIQGGIHGGKIDILEGIQEGIRGIQGGIQGLVQGIQTGIQGIQGIQKGIQGGIQ